MQLQALQQQFSDALLYKNDLISKQIKPKPTLEQEQLLQIYRNNFIMSVTEALSATYQHTLALVGEEFFNAISREFILQHPPHENNILNYGQGFSDFLAQLEQLQSLHYVKEMARFEWLLEQTSNSELQQQQLNLEKLAGINEQQLSHIVFNIPTQASLFSSEQNIQNLYEMIINNQVQAMDLQEACYLMLIKQADFSVEIMTLSEQEFSLLLQINQKKTLAEIQPNDLHQLLPNLMEKKLLNGFTIKDPS